jgi:hypothetical protein
MTQLLTIFPAKFGLTNSDRTVPHAANSGFKKLAVQLLNEHLCSVSSVVLADSFVLRNRQLLKPTKRYLQAFVTTLDIKINYDET